LSYIIITTNLKNCLYFFSCYNYLEYLTFLIMENKKNCKLSKSKKVLLISFGTLSLGVAALGVVLPLLPTTPFLLITSACYIRSSEKLYCKVTKSRLFKKYMQNIIENKTLPLKLKIGLVLFVWVVMLILFFFVFDNIYLKILAIFLASAKTVFMFCYRKRS
jgi:uncharacterized protein